MSIKVLSNTGAELDAAIKAVNDGLELGSGEISSSGFFGRTQPNGRIVINGTTIVANAFRACKQLLSVNGINVLSVADNVFRDCTGLQSVDLPVATIIGGDAFTSCSALTEVTLPEVTALTYSQFVSCKNLSKVDLPKVTTLNNKVFEGCNSLTTLILRSGTLCTLGSANVFDNTPFEGYSSLTGTVYVPAALISSYQTATNWATMYAAGTCNFVAIERSEYE